MFKISTTDSMMAPSDSMMAPSDSMMAPSDSMKLFILVGWDWSSFVCCLVHRGLTNYFLLLRISNGVVWQTRDLHLSCNALYLLSPGLCFFIVLKRDLFVYLDDSLTS